MALKTSPVVFLNGARQVGKSTLVYGLSAGKDGGEDAYHYVTFDRPTQMAAAAAAPEAFLNAHSKLIIDEVQLVPEIFRALKIIVDENRLEQKPGTNGRYLLTGSANILALPRLSDALVGRMSVLTLYPFSTAEVIKSSGSGLERLLSMNFSGMDDKGLTLVQAISMATFPEIADKSGAERRIWFDGYLNTMLQRDVKMLAELEKISALPTLLRILAIRAGNLLNDSDISRDLGLTSVTVKSYRNILKMMFLSFDIAPWHRNVGKRLVKSPKGYLADSLMLCHMLDMDIADIEANKPDIFGHVLENYVATELIKQLSYADTKAELLHFRTSDGKEVDFILERPDGTVFAIEVKKSENLNIHDFKGIQAFAALNPKEFAGGVILYAGKEAVPFGKDLWAVPFHVLWQ